MPVNNEHGTAHNWSKTCILLCRKPEGKVALGAEPIIHRDIIPTHICHELESRYLFMELALEQPLREVASGSTERVRESEPPPCEIFDLTR